MEERTEVEASGLVHDEESHVTSRNALPTDEPPPPPPQPTPQDFSSLLFMMQQQMQSQHMMREVWSTVGLARDMDDFERVSESFFL